MDHASVHVDVSDGSKQRQPALAFDYTFPLGRIDWWNYADGYAGGLSLHAGLWAALGAALPLARLWASIRAPRAARRIGRCPSCSYDLTANVSGVCPECGTTISNRPTTRS